MNSAGSNSICDEYLCCMKAAIYSSKYFIVTGLFILICFTGIGIFMTNKFKQRTKQISVELATKVYQLKANIIRNEFNSFVQGVSNSASISSQVHTISDFYRLKPVIRDLLLAHPRINTGWYAIAGKKDTLYRRVKKEGSIYKEDVLPPDEQKWLRGELKSKKAGSGALINIADSLHWLVSSKYKLDDASLIMYGLDINLKDLQRYLWSVDTTGRASVFIANQERYYISNQLEHLIGTKMPDSVKSWPGETLLSDSVSSYDIVTSSYLQIPVFRYYSPLNVSSMNWMMVVDTPMLAVDEDINAIEKYVSFLFLSSALIILLLIAWSQTKWQKEFMLRQEAELTATRQEKENAILQLDKLKEKVNPHFLFNSLSSLNGLIEEHPEVAKSFVIKLSKVYRYVLDPAPNGLSEVSKELRFATEYFFLLKIRFGDALAPLIVELNDKHLNVGYVPFMSIQTLIENAVKHNVLSKTKPLQIKIFSKDGAIHVTNNLQLRNDVKDSSKQGLKYLQLAYAHFGDYKLIHGISGDLYESILPVLNSSNDHTLVTLN